MYLFFCCMHPRLTWSTYCNSLTHSIQATWISKGWCNPLQGAYVCVHVCVLYMWVPDVCMLIPGSLAAGFRSCVGGLSFLCVCVLWCIESCWVCLTSTRGWECSAGITQEGLLVHEPGPIRHVYRPNTAVEYTSPLMHVIPLFLTAESKSNGIIRYWGDPRPAALQEQYPCL